MEEEQDIQSDIVKRDQLLDAQKNAPKDKAIKASGKAHKAGNITDEEHIENLKNAPNLLGSQLLDNIQGKFVEAGSAVMEASQEDPDTWTDDLIRIGLGGVKNVGTVLGAPGIKQLTQLVGAPAYYVGRGLGYGLEKAGVDPRYGHIAGEVGEWFIPGYGMYKAAGKVSKYSKIAGTAALSDATALMVRQNPMYASGTGIIPSGGELKNLANNLKNSINKGLGRIIPSSMTSQQTRGWFAKLPRTRILEVGEELGGARSQLKQIAKEQVDEFKDIENTVSELNHMWRVWAEGRSLGFENSQIVVKKMPDGSERLVIKDWKGPDKDWESFSAFNKDHIRAVINSKLSGGGLFGANMADNLEVLFAATNRRKSNLFQLDDRILKNIGVPKNIETYIFRKLHPEFVELEKIIPKTWRETYVKNILNDYYEQAKKLKSRKKLKSKMGQLVKKYTSLYRDKAFIAGLEGLQKDLDKLMQSNIQKGIPGKQIPEWMRLLEMPPNPSDKWWLDLPKDAQERWLKMVREKRTKLQFDEYRGPTKERYYR